MFTYTQKNNKSGFLKWIIIIIIALIAASYFFDFSVQEAVEDEQTQQNFNYISTNLRTFWDEHMATSAHYLWDDIVVDLLWDGFVKNMQRIRDGEATEFENFAPNIDLGSNRSLGDIVNDPIESTFIESGINE